ncbi:hypothetical protein [Streptomyces sp. SAS_276]
MASMCCLLMRLVPAKTRGVITGLLVAIQRVIAIAAIQAGGLVLDAHVGQAFPEDSWSTARQAGR